ncbi:MAG: type II secretion system protein [Candidatus Sungbacteria bacterium]|nr:type II secretion system protein [Candidatus Sungbacteria bacterium]
MQKVYTSPTRRFPLPDSRLSSSGFTLIEMTVYVGLLGLLAILMTTILVKITTTYQRTRAERAVVSNSRLLAETLSKTIASSREAYAPTSAFNTDAGQLTLVTGDAPIQEHETKFIDFWIDAGQLLVKEEGKPPSVLSAASVRIKKFRIERIVQGLNRESIRFTLGIEAAHSAAETQTTITTAATLRGNY